MKGLIFLCLCLLASALPSTAEAGGRASVLLLGDGCHSSFQSLSVRSVNVRSHHGRNVTVIQRRGLFGPRVTVIR